MNIALLNGSPKSAHKSNTGILLGFLRTKLNAGNTVSEYGSTLYEEQLAELADMDAIVTAFPLYVDAIPSHLLRTMVQLDEHIQKNPLKHGIYVYALANNGFYEGKQNEIALQIIKNWCSHTGFIYGQGIGQGAGEMLPFISNVPLGHGPHKNLRNALAVLNNNIQNRQKGDDILFSPNFPYIDWRFMATNVFWNAEAKKNGLRKKDIVKRL
ncbi:hypothetical protein [Treponema endosymbiont of Eucomonympha sp.]|uniref:hypothetical protein n=1 Tax=Treponema endosymbiont of Eucomonympha sp. TaxID=1580831 RepID=UPI000750FAB6|nr:hypothetical protein [Treponema endosymbiont of Eucomonympha sp.]